MIRRWMSGFLIVLLSVLFVAVACKKKDNPTTPASPTDTFTFTFTVTGSGTPTRTITRTPTATFSITSTPTATPTITRTLTATLSPTWTWTRTVTLTATVSHTPTPSGTPTVSRTPTITSTPTPQIVCTVLVTPTPQTESGANEFCGSQFQEIGTLNTGGQIAVTGILSPVGDQDTYRFYAGSTATYSFYMDCFYAGTNAQIEVFDDACNYLKNVSGTGFVATSQAVTAGSYYKVQLLSASVQPSYHLLIQAP